MHRKGLGGMYTMDNACIGAKSVHGHIPWEKTQSKVVRLERERAFEQTQTIQHTAVVHG